jgi:hypothetical protein
VADVPAAPQIENTRRPTEAASDFGNELVTGATTIADKKYVAELAVRVIRLRARKPHRPSTIRAERRTHGRWWIGLVNFRHGTPPYNVAKSKHPASNAI